MDGFLMDGQNTKDSFSFEASLFPDFAAEILKVM